MDSLERFLKMHEINYQQALQEIKKGRKESHFMWYIFPQIKGLGKSDIAKYYEINNIEEAKKYYNHPILKQHLIELSQVLLSLNEKNIIKIMGYPDNLKLCSCMTLFNYIQNDCDIFQKVIDKYYDGKEDQRTIELLNN